ncbi:MAG: ABC transporter ATP-binding protein, partial [Clostridia bacterium]|nr:ABC transporter ATP-binding protein [Clostridia bacterium]
MARNKFDGDDRLETPFQWTHLKRAGKYIAKHKYKMLLALLLSALASVSSLFIPKITQWVLDEAVPNKDTAMIGKMAILFVGVIGLGI